MHLINILVVTISVLTILSALALIFGSSKSERRHSLWFLVAAIGEVVWSCSIAFFLSLDTGDIDYAVAPWLIKGIYVGAFLMDTAILGYVAWRYKTGRVITLLFLAAGAVLSTIFLYDPSILYSSYTLSNGGNFVTIDMGQWFYIAYIIYFCAITPSFCTVLIYHIRHTKNKDTKKGYLFFLIGLIVAGCLTLIFDLIMPLQRYSLIWVGPLTIGLVMIGFYYAVLRYRIIQLATTWLKVLSSIVILSGAFIIYLLIFHLVFSALFKVANPSFQVVLLNFIMVAIVLLLAPAISEMFSFTRSLIMVKQIDVAYIVKKLTALNRKKLDFKDVAGFLAEHMHFSYVDFLINGKYFGSENHKLPALQLEHIAELPKPDHGIWQDTDTLGKDIIKDCGISRVAVLADVNGEIIGQVILGTPTTKSSLDRKDLAEVEIIINLMETIIEHDSRRKS